MPTRRSQSTARARAAPAGSPTSLGLGSCERFDGARSGGECGAIAARPIAQRLGEVDAADAIVAVEIGPRGPEIILSRSHPNFVRRLFETEVSEIADKTVEIRGIAREAGYRTKIAVHSANDKVDPVGACVGMKGSRVKNIVRELNNEIVDIIRWSADVMEFVLEALKPAKIKSVTLDPVKKAVQLRVDEDQLSLAIGKRGQNARLTSRLVGWEINIEKDETAKEAFAQSVTKAAAALAAALKVDEAIARKLITAGMNSAEVIVGAEPQDIADATGVDLEQAQAIYNAAQSEYQKGEGQA